MKKQISRIKIDDEVSKTALKIINNSTEPLETKEVE